MQCKSTKTHDVNSIELLFHAEKQINKQKSIQQGVTHSSQGALPLVTLPQTLLVFHADLG